MSTIAAIIERHGENPLLQAPTLSPMRASSRDLSVDQPTATTGSAILETLEQGQIHCVKVPNIGEAARRLVQCGVNTTPEAGQIRQE